MKGLALLVALLSAGASPAAAQPADAERQGVAMAQTVLDQLAAFRQGDWEAAYGFASATIQAQLTKEAFREMVTRGYAPIAAPARSTVLGTRVVDAQHGFVEIRVYGRSGDAVDALYELVEERGAWKINGVLARPAPPGETVLRRGRYPSHPVVLAGR